MSKKWKQRGIIAFIVYLFLVYLLMAAPLYAATVAAPIIGDYTITQDTEVVLNGIFPESTPGSSLGSNIHSGILADVDTSVTAGPGVVVTVDMDQFAYSGAYVYGIAAWGSMNSNTNPKGALVSLDEVHVSVGRAATNSAYSMGVFAMFGGEVHIGDNSTIYAYRNGVAAHSANDGSSLTIGNNSVLYGTASYYGAVTAYGSLRGATTTMTIGNGAVISNDGYYAENVNGGSGSNHFAVQSVSPRDGAGDAVTALLTIGDGADISAGGSGNRNCGLVAGDMGLEWWSGEIVTGSNTTINTYGAENNMGLYAVWTGSSITIGADSDVTTRGNASYGAYAWRGGDINIGAGSDIVTNGDNSSGLRAHGAAVTGQASGDNSVIITADGVTVETRGKAAHGVYASAASADYGARVLLGTGNKIITLSDDAHGILAAGGGAYVSMGTGSEIETVGSGARGVAAVDGGYVRLDGASITVGDGAAKAIFADSGNSNTSYVYGNGVFNISGDMYAGASSSVDLTMGEGSLFAGATGVQSADNGELSLNMEKSRWNVTNDSSLTALTLDDSTVSFQQSPAFTTLTVEKLNTPSSGTGGLFILKADMPNEVSDQIIVTDSNSSGRYDMRVLNVGDISASGDEVVTVAKTAFGSSVSFDLTNIVECGGWRYDMNYQQGAVLPGGTSSIENEWQLRGTGQASTSGSGAINSFAGSYLMAYADTQTLIQRMGDLRQSPYGNGLWFRVHGGKFESNAKCYVRDFDMDYGGVQIGYDRKLENKWDGTLYTGVMFGYGKGDLDYHREGSGEVDSKTLGVYGTYVGKSGFYVDAILKYQWMTNDFDVIDTAGTLVRGQEVDTGGVGASVEFGQRLHIGNGQESGTGWYVEPQVQLSYQRQDGGYFNASNGLRIGVEPFTSILGRVGMLVGYETEKANFYAKVSKVKEFDGDLTVKANGVPIQESFASSWWVYGIGFTSRINERNSLYLDIERASGGSFSQPWRIFAGWRLEF